MTDTPPVLPLHNPADNRFSLRFISDTKQDLSKKKSQLSNKSTVETIHVEESLDKGIIYLLYTRPLFETAFPTFETHDDVIEWFTANFSGRDRQVLFAIIDIFDGILTEKENLGADISMYKKMDLEKIPDILNRVEWRQLVPDVGAELLSYFILAHPMPNTNHRTGIGLLDRYLTSYDGGFAMPATGEADQWYKWAREFIYHSKRILTLRNQLPLLRWAHQYGYECAERKEGIQITLEEIDLDRADYRSYYANRHLDRTRKFVETALEEADATHLRQETDDGKRAFGDRLRKNA